MSSVHSGHDTPVPRTVAAERIFHDLALFDRAMDLSSPYAVTGYGALSDHQLYLPHPTQPRTTAMSRFLDEEPREGPNVAVARTWMRFEEHLSSPPPQPGPISHESPSTASPKHLRPSVPEYVILICELIAAKYIKYGSVANAPQIHTLPYGPTSTGQTQFRGPTAGSPSRKRSVQEADTSPDEPEEMVHVAVNRKRIRVAVAIPRMYACPCYRHDPHSLDFQLNGRFEKCRTEGIKPGKVKQHIRRIHTKPAQCPNCGRRGDRGDIQTHMDQINCQPNAAMIRVSDDTLNKENQLNKSGNTTWHAVFAILFPLHTPPPTDAAQYFVSEAEPGHNISIRQDRLAHVLAAHLESSATALERLLSSAEYRLIASSGTNSSGAPIVHAAAARLMTILSAAPFVEGVPPVPVVLPVAETPLVFLDESFWQFSDWDGFLEGVMLSADENLV